jgi:hypothetical protein
MYGFHFGAHFETGPETHHIITQLHPQMATGRRYRSFAGKGAAPVIASIGEYIVTFRRRRR